MIENLTTQKFWENYWANFKPFDVEKNVPFGNILNLFPRGEHKFIEIGGFPGTFSIYFKKKYNYRVTLLDYFVKTEVINALERANGLQSNALEVISTDFLNYVSSKQYDVVFSWGFIEHFKNTSEILKKHVDLMTSGGTLLVGLPNFLGLNGLVQRLLDPKNLEAHYLPSMDIKILTGIASQLDLKKYRVFYSGKPCLWLEPTARVHPIFRLTIKIFSRLISFMPFSGRFLSPYIVIYGQK